MIAETKLNESFPDSQFKISEMIKPYRLDVSANSGVFLYMLIQLSVVIRVYLNSIQKNIQAIIFEINIQSQRLLMLCIYRPPKQNRELFLYI